MECFLINIDSVDVMAPFCLELKKRGINCNLALDELFWKVSYGKHFDIDKAIDKAENWGMKLNFRLNYDADIAVTQWKSDWALFRLYKNLKARISYGANTMKETIFTDYSFDLYFVYGDFEKEVLLEKGIDEKRIIKISSPKLFYQKNQNLNLKNTLVYFPTWDKFSTIDWILEKLKKLDFNVLVKPHPLSFLVPEKKYQIDMIKKYGFEIVDYNTRTLVENADVIVIDFKSGATWDVLFFGVKKPIVVVYNKKDKSGYFNFFDEFDLAVSENDEIILPKKVKNKEKLKNYIFEKNLEYEKLKSLNMDKISKTFKDREIDILKERLEKTYNFLRNKSDKN